MVLGIDIYGGNVGKLLPRRHEKGAAHHRGDDAERAFHPEFGLAIPNGFPIPGHSRTTGIFLQVSCEFHGVRLLG